MNETSPRNPMPTEADFDKLLDISPDFNFMFPGEEDPSTKLYSHRVICDCTTDLDVGELQQYDADTGAYRCIIQFDTEEGADRAWALAVALSRGV